MCYLVITPRARLRLGDVLPSYHPPPARLRLRGVLPSYHPSCPPRLGGGLWVAATVAATIRTRKGTRVSVRVRVKGGVRPRRLSAPRRVAGGPQRRAASHAPTCRDGRTWRSRAQQSAWRPRGTAPGPAGGTVPVLMTCPIAASQLSWASSVLGIRAIFGHPRAKRARCVLSYPRG